MSLEKALRAVAADMGAARTQTGALAAPAKLRHRTGTIDGYTPGEITASVLIGSDLIDAPFLGQYAPKVGDVVSVMLNNGAPLILGSVNAAPVSGGGVIMQTAFQAVAFGSNDPIEWASVLGDDIGPTADYVDLTAGVLSLLQSCWLEVSVRADMSGVTGGEPVELYLSLDGDPIAEIDRGPAKSNGTARASTTSGLYYFDFDNDDPTITAGINADDASGSFVNAVVKIAAVAGVTP